MKASNRPSYNKANGEHHPSDMLTKYVPRVLLNRHCDVLRLAFVEGRAETAPTLNSFEIQEQHCAKKNLPKEFLYAIDQDVNIEVCAGSLVGKIADMRRHLHGGDGVGEHAVPAGHGVGHGKSKHRGSRCEDDQGIGGRQRLERAGRNEVVGVGDQGETIETGTGISEMGAVEVRGGSWLCGACSQLKWHDMDDSACCQACRRTMQGSIDA